MAPGKTDAAQRRGWLGLSLAPMASLGDSRVAAGHDVTATSIIRGGVAPRDSPLRHSHAAKAAQLRGSFVSNWVRPAPATPSLFLC